MAIVGGLDVRHEALVFRMGVWTGTPSAGHPAQHRDQPSPLGRRHLDRPSLAPKRPRSVPIPTTPWTHLKRSYLDLAKALAPVPIVLHCAAINARPSAPDTTAAVVEFATAWVHRRKIRDWLINEYWQAAMSDRMSGWYRS